jgi:hypothetical protein
MHEIPNPNELRAAWAAEYARPFSGWDFSYLEGRRITIRPDDTWDYTAAVLEAIDHAQSMLDMATGGGEALAALPRRPPRTVATEGYAPNVQIARGRLEPLGIEVVEVRDPARLPFDAGSFALVTNRHAEYGPRDVRRVLVDGGRFITQQVGSRTNRRLHELLGHPPPPEVWNLAAAVEGLAAGGFQIIEQREELFTTRYLDVGALVYYLKAVSWEIPDFSVDRYFDKLLEIHALILAEGYVDIPFHQFFIRALAPGLTS